MKRASGLLVMSVAALAACGGGGDGGGDGACNPSGATSVTITSTGVSRKAVCVLPGGTVTFFNNDTQQHVIESDGSCPELNVGAIAPSANKNASVGATEGACPFREAGDPTNAAFQGTVFVTSVPEMGPGH